jgi:hypothetical protein
MTDVLDQLETLGAARRELVQTPRAFVLTVYVLRPDYTLGDELQSSSASVAAQILAHRMPILGRTESMLPRSMSPRRLGISMPSLSWKSSLLWLSSSSTRMPTLFRSRVKACLIVDDDLIATPWDLVMKPFLEDKLLAQGP